MAQLVPELGVDVLKALQYAVLAEEDEGCQHTEEEDDEQTHEMASITML